MRGTVVTDLYPNLLNVCINPNLVHWKTVDGKYHQSTNTQQISWYLSDCIYTEIKEQILCDAVAVRFCCPGEHGAKTCMTEENIAAHPINETIEIFIQENIEIEDAVLKLSYLNYQTYTENITSLNIVYGN
ncbi:uncharacterized protein LOC144350482 [Saccoglossus kowalevskii]